MGRWPPKSRRALPPAQRVRSRLATRVGRVVAAGLPAGYQRLGRVLVLRLAEDLRPHFPMIGEAWQRELGVETVVRRYGPVGGELRIPQFETIAGAETRTEVMEFGIRYQFDARTILFARGNRTERQRAGAVTRPGETVVDLFAGIGYFALPAAIRGGAGCVWAVEKNPESFRYLEENVALNGVRDRVRPILGDNRIAELPRGTADRVFLGYLPNSTPWIPRALELLGPGGGTVHAHLVVGVRDGLDAATAEVVGAVGRAGGRVESTSSRRVKSYGPGRLHAVVDVVARPGR